MTQGRDLARPRATIVDVAQAAGVSRQTVSNVLNNPERVASPTLARVRQEIERLGFTPNAAAQQLRRHLARAYGFEVNPSAARRMGHIVDGFLVELTVAAPGYNSHLVTFASEAENPITGYERLLGTGLVDGFVITDTLREDPRPRWLVDNEVPFVSFGRMWDSPELGRWVDVDGRAGMEMAVRHLLAMGYERVAYLGWESGSPLGDDRRRGWLAALAEAGLAEEPLAGYTRDELMDATRAANGLLDRLAPLDGTAALLCASDMLALGAMRSLRGRGLEAGRDVGLVGFDDSTVAEALRLTSLRQPLHEAAHHAWRILHQAGSDSSLSALLSPSLIIRSSSSFEAA
ncbi:LacI family DNA-binding transcriptional regulator [Pedococcus sp. 5OH_020]|uniref:LacI family DNA-binding transcriptional regulator n=1 Tax=Pedococcus sp. 5OH_020 TaxID=2989814 RepID=UPI0022E9E434|nr:substrate-binding domain-containing protein [Pedococcus sp. 5OH_020]